jgi:DNA modification methylase
LENGSIDMEINTIINGDCLEVLKTLPEGSIDCCVTSPPYYALRDYGVDGQLGLEETPEKYIEKMTEVFMEVYRVLKDDGTLWLNIGDSYWGGGWRNASLNEHSGDIQKAHKGTHCGEQMPACKGMSGVYKPKDLIGIPWMLAFSLRNAGWYLRQDIIWHKPNPMPESVTDRCTKSHEYVFLLSKSPKYYFNHEAIQEPAIYAGDNRGERADSRRGTYMNSMSGITKEMRNKRDVWSINVKPCKEAHFATYPFELVKPCILAGCPEDGVVLDPFMGSGTTALVAKGLGRNYLGIELNPQYVELANKRLYDTFGLFL